MNNIAAYFVSTAEMYGRIIIAEYSFPIEKKTFKPVSVGGVAGGEKYIVAGILFKVIFILSNHFQFAIDIYGLYGGDENAMKAASHDLKGLQQFFHSGVEGIHLPLMALINFRGFRLMALSLLPVQGKTSLVYGSLDGGVTVASGNEEIQQKMKKAGIALNLKPHMVGSEGTVEVYGPCDLEGHVGTDNRFYLLDFARTAPPEPPTVKYFFLFFF